MTGPIIAHLDDVLNAEDHAFLAEQEAMVRYPGEIFTFEAGHATEWDNPVQLRFTLQEDSMDSKEHNDWTDIPERDPSPPDDPGVRRWRRERDYYERADVEYERSMDR